MEAPRLPTPKSGGRDPNPHRIDVCAMEQYQLKGNEQVVVLPLHWQTEKFT